MTNLTIHCPKCKHRHEVACESVWDERGLLREFVDWYNINKSEFRGHLDVAIDTFLKERDG